MRFLAPAAALVTATAFAAGCETPVGRYFANRARDFGECFRLEMGGGVGLGGGVNAAGLVHLGIHGGGLDSRLAVGWAYGHGYAFGLPTSGRTDGSGDAYPPLGTMAWHGITGQWHRATRGEPGSEGYRSVHRCILLLPCVFSRVGNDDRLLWEREDSAVVRKARVHAFDIEVSAYALVVGAAAGFSPGEFLDFLAGWFGLDLAGDDSG